MLEGWLAILRASPAKAGPARRLPLAPPAGDSSPGAAAAVGARHVDDRLLRDQQVHRSTTVNLAHQAGTRRDDASRLFLSIAGWHDELPVSRAYVHLFKPM
jgi:hypothetical protein